MGTTELIGNNNQDALSFARRISRVDIVPVIIAPLASELPVGFTVDPKADVVLKHPGT